MKCILMVLLVSDWPIRLRCRQLFVQEEHLRFGPLTNWQLDGERTRLRGQDFIGGLRERGLDAELGGKGVQIWAAWRSNEYISTQ